MKTPDKLSKIDWQGHGKRWLFAYAVLVVIMYATQRNYMYVPYDVFPNPTLIGVGDMDVITVKTADGLEIRGVYKGPAQADKPVIIHFHGNGGSIAIRGYRARDYIDHGGYGYMLAEYRGYAGNPGKPTEQGLYEDARAYIKWLAHDQKIPVSRMVFYGESLGTGIATQMALEFPDVHALVLEAPYTSMAAVAQRHMFWLPAYWLVKDRYNNIDRIEGVTAPLLVLHGQKDSIVPFSHGNSVYERAKTEKRFEIFSEGGHVNLYNYNAGGKVRDFLAELASN